VMSRRNKTARSISSPMSGSAPHMTGKEAVGAGKRSGPPFLIIVAAGTALRAFARPTPLMSRIGEHTAP